MKRTSRGSTRSQASDRGNVPQIGLALLFVLVFVGGALVLATGGILLDSLEAQSEAERTRLVMEEDDHCLATTVVSDGPCALHSDDVETDGKLEVTWWGDPSADEETVTIEPLGSLEYDHRDRTFANQGGGRWEISDDGRVRVLEAPGIGYDDGTLDLTVRSISADDSAGGEMLARSDARTGSELQNELETAAASGHPNVTVTVESEYHEAWNAHFQRAFSPDEHERVSVTHDPNAGTVTAEIIELSEPTSDGPILEVTEDRGIADAPDQRVERGSQFDLEAEITNTGDEAITPSPNDGDSYLRAVIEPDGFALENTERNPPVFDAGESKSVTFNFQYGNYKDHLEPGNTYEYVIETGDDRTDDPPGSFYYGTEGIDFALDEANATVDETVTVRADLRNIGIEDGDRDVTLRLDPGLGEDEYDEFDFLNDDGEYVYTLEDVNRTFGESARISWTMNRSAMIEGDYEYAIEVDGEDERVSGTFSIDVGVDPGETELEFDGSGTVDVTLLGAETSTPYGTADIPSRMYHAPEVEGGLWTSDGDGGWSYDWDGRRIEGLDVIGSDPSLPDWNENGGWRTDGEFETRDCGWACEEYVVDGTTEFWWDDDGGYQIVWDEHGGDWSWAGDGDAPTPYPTHVQNLVPIDLEVVFEDADNGTEIRRTTPWVGDEENVNTRDVRHRMDDDELTESYEVDNAVMTISATSYGDGSNCRTGWDDPTVDDPYRFVEGDGEGLWFDRECHAMSEADEWENVDVAGDEGHGQVRVRSAENNTMPELRGFHEGQKRADELLPDDMFTGEFDESGNALLNLDENEFLYLFELTASPGPGDDPDEFFEEAKTKDEDETGDPNFNDVIVHVEVRGNGAPEELEDPFLELDAGGDEPVETGYGESDTDAGAGGDVGDGPNVDVGTDHIVIG